MKANPGLVCPRLVKSKLRSHSEGEKTKMVVREQLRKEILTFDSVFRTIKNAGMFVRL